MQDKHKKVFRDYLGRVNDKEFPKYRAAELAKKWDFDYWDGDRRICYGGYKYVPGYWRPIAEKLIEIYNLNPKSKVLEIGCGKGFLLTEIAKLVPGINLNGIDISSYAINQSHLEVRKSLVVGNATSLPWRDQSFDLAFSLNTFHNLYAFDLERALREISRVSSAHYLCVESYRNEIEKQNLLYWQVTCEAFNTPEEWLWWFERTEYTGDYEFIFFEEISR